MCGLVHLPAASESILWECRRFPQTEIPERGGKNLHCNHRYLSTTLLLTAALAAPLAVNAATSRFNIPGQEEHRRDDDNRNRYYDRQHRDYHHWDDNEDRSYRVYLGERHRDYRPFAEVRESDRRAYWSWRHRHPDHDHDGR
jgi:hypothetical protein